MSDEDVAIWVAAYDAVDDPRVRSRIGDLLWSRSAQPEPHLKGRAACEALVKLSRLEDWESMETTEDLVRALDLAREMSDTALAQTVASRIVEVVDDELARDDRPGVAFSLLRALVDLQSEHRPHRLPDLVRRSAQTYGGDPHNLESTIELEIALASTPESRTTLRTRQGELWRDAAAKAGGIVRASFLEKALDVARTHGLKELARVLRVEIQSVTDEDLGLKTVSAEIKIDRDKVDRFHAAFVRFDSWDESLTAFGSYGPARRRPGDDGTSGRTADEGAPVAVPRHQGCLRPGFGAPVFQATDDASHKLAAMAQSQWMGSQIWAVSAVTILERFAERYGRPSRDDLANFFTSAHRQRDGGADRARVRAVVGRPPGRERAHARPAPRGRSTQPRARDRPADHPRTHSGKPGTGRPLGELLYQLHERFGSEAWRTYVLHLLVDQLGLNLRNVIAHGVRARIERKDAALLLHAAVFLRLVQVG